MPEPTQQEATMPAPVQVTPFQARLAQALWGGKARAQAVAKAVGATRDEVARELDVLAGLGVVRPEWVEAPGGVGGHWLYERVGGVSVEPVHTDKPAPAHARAGWDYGQDQYGKETRPPPPERRPEPEPEPEPEPMDAEDATEPEAEAGLPAEGPTQATDPAPEASEAPAPDTTADDAGGWRPAPGSQGEALLDAVKAHPGSTQTELRRLVDQAPATLSSRLVDLRGRGCIVRDVRGRYWPAGHPEAPRQDWGRFDVPTRGRVLSVLANNGAMRRGRLLASLKIGRNALSAALEGLQAEGLVVQTGVRGPWRLTEAGHRHLREAEAGGDRTRPGLAQGDPMGALLTDGQPGSLRIQRSNGATADSAPAPDADTALAQAEAEAWSALRASLTAEQRALLHLAQRLGRDRQHLSGGGDG